MLVTVYQNQWMTVVPLDAIRTDPTRMAQGIMTGIGFLGAGTIMREGLSVRGLTTAASIWITAAIGILIGIGFYLPAVIGTVLTLVTLSVFRWIESYIPTWFYAHLVVRFARDQMMSEQEMRRMLADHGFSVANLNYRLDGGAGFFEYRMVIATHRSANASRLKDTLSQLQSIKEYQLSPTGD